MIVDEFGKLRLAHRVSLPSNQPCFPFTWHQRWKDHDPLEVTFKGTAPECHSIVFKGQSVGPGVPRYIFTTQKDYIDFQSQVRGKELVCSVDFRQLKTATSAKLGEATDQQLTIWRDYITQEHSISFYASAAEKPQHVEFPVAMFNQDLKSADDEHVELDFTVVAETKGRLSKAFSRSPTERSTSSTSGPSIFSRTQTGMTVTTAATTVTESQMSVASFNSASSNGERRKNSLPTIESRAKHMKYLSIEFSDLTEASRFRHRFQTAYKEELSRPLDLFLNWQLDTARTESVASGHSESGTTSKSMTFDLDGVAMDDME